MNDKHLTQSNSSLNLVFNNDLAPHILPVYNLDNPPPLSAEPWEIEQLFLRNIKKGAIPNLKFYLSKLSVDDWNCLLAENYRPEFLNYLSREMKAELDLDYILLCNRLVTLCA